MRGHAGPRRRRPLVRGAAPGRGRETHFVEGFLAAGAGEGGEGGQDGVAERHGAAGRDGGRRGEPPSPPYNAGAGALKPIAGSGGNASRTGRAGGSGSGAA